MYRAGGRYKPPGFGNTRIAPRSKVKRLHRLATDVSGKKRVAAALASGQQPRRIAMEGYHHGRSDPVGKSNRESESRTPPGWYQRPRVHTRHRRQTIIQTLDLATSAVSDAKTRRQKQRWILCVPLTEPVARVDQNG